MHIRWCTYHILQCYIWYVLCRILTLYVCVYVTYTLIYISRYIDVYVQIYINILISRITDVRILDVCIFCIFYVTICNNIQTTWSNMHSNMQNNRATLNSLRLASPQGSDQTVKPRPWGLLLEPYVSPPYPRPSNQPTLNRPTRHPILNCSPWGNPCVGVASKGSLNTLWCPPYVRVGPPPPAQQLLHSR